MGRGDGFGIEAKLRGLFEACMAQNRKRYKFQMGGEREEALTEQQIQAEIDEYMRRERVQWASFTPERAEHTLGGSSPKEDDVPLVSVCVEGGLFTISTVFEAVNNGVFGVMF